MKALKGRGSEILKRIKDINKPIIAEVGTREGKLAMFLLKSRKEIVIYAVDNWLGKHSRSKAYKETGDKCAMWSAAEAKAVKATAMENIAEKAIIIEKDSTKAAAEIKDGVLDLVFLDADHSYQKLTKDIEAWLPKIKKGGWIGGHDYDNPHFAFGMDVKKAVDETFDQVETGLNYTWWVQV